MSFVDPLISWLAATAFRSSVLILLIWGLQLMFRRWMPAKWRLLLWLPVLVVMAAPLLPECGLSVDRWFPKRAPDGELCCPTSPAACGLPLALPDSGWNTSAAVVGWWTIAGCWLVG